MGNYRRAIGEPLAQARVDLVVAQPREVVGRQELCLIRADDRGVKARSAALNDHGFQAETGDGCAGRSPHVSFLDRSGQRALGSYRKPSRARDRGPRQDARGQDQDVAAAEGFALRIDLPGQERGDQSPAA